MKSTESMLWDFIETNEIATEKEIDLVTNICGYNEKSMMNIIFARTGYRSVEQLNDDGSYMLSDELLDRFGLLEEVEEYED